MGNAAVYAESIEHLSIEFEQLFFFT